MSPTEKNSLFIRRTSVDTEMCCPKGKCGCQYFILLTFKKKKNHGHRGPVFLFQIFIIAPSPPKGYKIVSLIIN
jgi:hypothetical protein